MWICRSFVICLNSERPYSDETVKLAEQMKEKYQTPVIPVSCEQLRKDDINNGAISVSIFARIRCTEGDVARSFTPYLLP